MKKYIKINKLLNNKIKYKFSLKNQTNILEIFLHSKNKKHRGGVKMEKNNLKRQDIKNIIEAIMFSYGEPVSIRDLNLAINEELSPKEIEIMLNILISEYKEANRGIQVIRLGDKYQMCSNPEYADFIKKIMEPSRKKILSQATLETLIIIAYKQPITRTDIESIRGVKCDRVVNTLIENNLIYEAGRLDKIGKPIMYKTTDDFLKLLEIESLEDLPNKEKISFK